MIEWVILIMSILVLVYSSRKKRIGFCMLIKDDFPTQRIWNEYLTMNKQCSIVIHGKKGVSCIDPSCTELIKRARFIRNPINTSWGDLSLVRAQNMCIRKLLKDPNISRILTVSGNCVPLKSECEILARTCKNESVFTEFHVPDRLESLQNTVMDACPIKKENFKIHSQWCVLTREHASLIAGDEYAYIDCFKKTGNAVSDETVYLTILQYNNRRNINIIPCVRGDGYIYGTTFSQWKNIGYKYAKSDDVIPNGSPKMYDTISYDELQYLKNSDFLCVRKFSDNTTVDTMGPIINFLW